MYYNKNTWANGDLITKEKLNHMEDGIYDANNNIPTKLSQLTNDMLVKNSETLKQGTLDIAKESERAIVDIATLKKTNQDLIETLDGVIKIHEEGRAKRQEAEVELQNIEKELKDKILEIHVKPTSEEK